MAAAGRLDLITFVKTVVAASWLCSDTFFAYYSMLPFVKSSQDFRAKSPAVHPTNSFPLTFEIGGYPLFTFPYIPDFLRLFPISRLLLLCIFLPDFFPLRSIL